MGQRMDADGKAYGLSVRGWELGMLLVCCKNCSGKCKNESSNCNEWKTVAEDECFRACH